MNDALLHLSQLDDEGTKQLAALHHSVMHTLLSDMGLPVVLRYYQAAHDDLSVVGLYARSASGEILGWALGSPHPDRINARLRTPLTWFLLQMLRLAFTRPLVLWQLAASALGSSSDLETKRGAIELTYIGVVPHQRGRGKGKELLNAFAEASRARGYHSILLSVETDNDPALALYEKAGFRIIRTYSEGRYQRHRMELVLT